MRNSKIIALSLCLCIVAIPLPLASQGTTNEELLALFAAQRDAFRALAESGGQKTRGLEMVTVEDLTTAPAVADTTVATTENSTLATPDIGGAATITAATDSAPKTTVAGGLVTPVLFGQLAPELQVNVRIEFEFDSAALSATQRPKLAQLCEVMKSSDIRLFRIAGHTDASGPDAYNEKLSLLRAEEVMRYFTGECDMDAARLEAIGLGERFLHNPNDPKAGTNRRVEFQALV